MWVITLPTRIKRTSKSIRFRFILAYLLIIVLAFAAMGTAALQLVGEHMYKLNGETDLNYLSEAAAQIEGQLRSNDYKAVYKSCQNIASLFKARVLLLDKEGNVLSDSHSTLNGTKFQSDAFDYENIADKGQYQHIRKTEAGSIADELDCTRICLTAVRLEEGFILFSAFDADHVLNDLYSLAFKLLTALIVIILLITVLGFLITGSYTKPVKELSQAITQLSDGDFSVRVKEVGNNELTDLIRAFNEMTGRMEMLDRSRNQFVSNASHELKTPLATIKIMVQTLLYQEVYDEAMSKEFLGDVDKEVDRLSAVVSDLLTLVGMDSGESKLNMEEFSLSDMITEDVKRLSPLARERGIEMELNVTGAIDITGDRIKLDQVFYNLIDNAIKYTPRGEGVSVEVLRQNKNAVVRVKDNGIGIPEADLKHIFDRFYRVDKARSRETGGTGLGLSIAKQIILAHNGTISVSSKLDEGSIFTVVLPVGTKLNVRTGA